MAVAKSIYVPALKWKEGEQTSLNELEPSVFDHIVPLIELVPPEKPRFTKAMQDAGKPEKQAKDPFLQCQQDIAALKNVLGSRLYYLDPFWTVDRHDCSLYSEALKEARSHQARFIPVVFPGTPKPCMGVVRKTCQQDGLGLAVRVQLPTDPVGLSTLVLSAAQQAGVAQTDCDVILDAVEATVNSRWVATNLPALLAQLKKIGLRNVILLSGSMPSTLGDYGTGLFRLKRVEWEVYKHIRRQYPHPPVFGDYCVNSPEYSPSQFLGAPNIRYLDADCHVISRGVLHRKKSATSPAAPKPISQYHELAHLITADPAWRKETYSAGERFIKEVSGRTSNPGNQTNWRRTGTTCHITFVVDQLKKLASPAAAVLRLP